MIKEVKTITGVVLCIAVVIVPGISLSAGLSINPSPQTSVKSDSSRYGNLVESRFSDAEKLISQNKFSDAYLFLTGLSSKVDDEPDRQNLLGFSARKSGKLKKAASHYRLALKLDPEHKGALEYQGELFLMLGNLVKAEKNLALLKTLCPLGCSEVTELERAIASF